MTSESIYKLFILRKRKKHLPALYSAWACTLTEWSAFGLGIHACSLRCKAKQSTLLYISETFPADSVLFEVFLGQGYSLVCSMRLKKKLRDGKREEKHRLFFVPSVLWSVTLFDVSTEDLVLQQLLPNALIETLLSNRKRNKCYIELKLSWGDTVSVSSILYVCVLCSLRCVCMCVTV